MSSRVCFSFTLVSRMRTSSIHRRHATLVFVLGILIPRLVPCISLFISSISRAYCSTDRTHPCRMLSLIWIFLVGPNFVWIVAVRFSLSFFIIAIFGNLFLFCSSRTWWRLSMLCHMLSWRPGTWRILVVFVSWLHWLPLWGSADGPLWPCLFGLLLGHQSYRPLGLPCYSPFFRKVFLCCLLMWCLFRSSIFPWSPCLCIVGWCFRSAIGVGFLSFLVFCWTCSGIYILWL